MTPDVELSLRLTRAAAQSLSAHSSELCALDSVAGDGDHGFAMSAASKAILARLETNPPITVSELFSLIAVEFSNVGGSMGALLFVAADALSARWDHISSQSGDEMVATLLSVAQEAITEFGGAKPGDKTLIDALDAARTASLAAPKGESAAKTLKRAAAAARAGAAATAGMKAKIGRASRLGDVGRESPDPGATSVAIVMESVASVYR